MEISYLFEMMISPPMDICSEMKLLDTTEALLLISKGPSTLSSISSYKVYISTIGTWAAISCSCQHRSLFDNSHCNKLKVINISLWFLFAFY